MTAFDTLKAQYHVGSQLDVDGFPSNQPYQCFDVPEAYGRILSGNNKWYFFAPSGLAADYYNEYPNSPLLQASFDRLPATAQGQRGDIAVWGKAPATPSTHVAIVEEDRGTKQFVYGQNQPEAHITEKEITSNGLLGYLRPKGGDMPLTKEQIIVIYDLAFDTEDSQVNPDVIKAFTGKDVNELLTFLHQDASWLAHKNKINNPPAPSVNKQAVIDYLNSNLK